MKRLFEWTVMLFVLLEQHRVLLRCEVSSYMCLWDLTCDNLTFVHNYFPVLTFLISDNILSLFST